MTPLELYQVSGFDLSRMTEHDLLEVVEIEETSGLSRWGWEGYHTELLAAQSAVMIVARPLASASNRTGERIAGFVAARLAADEIHINNVAVRAKYRRRGIGGALLASALEQGKQGGAHKAFLEVRASNAAAQALYAQQGFEIVGRRPAYYSQPLEDALVMAVLL